jgi:hypothetical protein
MILLQVILVVGFLLVLFWFLSKPGSAQVKAWKRLAIVGLLGFSIVAVLVPSAADAVATFVGVYSGANLLLYVLAVSFVAFVLNQYVHNSDAHARVIVLTRRLAILEAQNRRLAAQLAAGRVEKPATPAS